MRDEMTGWILTGDVVVIHVRGKHAGTGDSDPGDEDRSSKAFVTPPVQF